MRAFGTEPRRLELDAPLIVVTAAVRKVVHRRTDTVPSPELVT
jgi:hypothetical protein